MTFEVLAGNPLAAKVLRLKTDFAGRDHYLADKEPKKQLKQDDKSDDNEAMSDIPDEKKKSDDNAMAMRGFFFFSISAR